MYRVEMMDLSVERQVLSPRLLDREVSRPKIRSNKTHPERMNQQCRERGARGLRSRPFVVKY